VLRLKAFYDLPTLIAPLVPVCDIWRLQHHPPSSLCPDFALEVSPPRCAFTPVHAALCSCFSTLWPGRFLLVPSQLCFVSPCMLSSDPVLPPRFGTLRELSRAMPLSTAPIRPRGFLFTDGTFLFHGQLTSLLPDFPGSRRHLGPSSLG